MRAFLATFLSVANRDLADAFGAWAKDATGGAVRTVPRRSAHVTHVFLGDIDDALAAEVAGDLTRLMASETPLDFELGAPEILRARREPRLVLAPVTAGQAAVTALTRRIADMLAQRPDLARVAPSRHAHVTVARFRRGAGPADAAHLIDLLATSRGRILWHEDRMASVELVRSELTPAGPVYDIVARAPAGRVA